MVLAELGGQISKALGQLAGATVIDDAILESMIKDLSTALLTSDVNVGLVKTMTERLKERVNLDEMPTGFNKRKFIQNVVFSELKGLLDPGVTPFKPIRSKPNVIMFVGLQGSGKTTTCTKYALYHQTKGWKVGVICADTFRAGAYDQLKQNAAKAKVAFFGSMTETDPAVTAREGVKKMKKDGMDLIIVDTSGRHKQEAALFDEMEQIRKAVQPDDIIFTMDSSIGQAAHDQATAFKERVPIGSVIITKLDGHAKGGGALSAVAATKSPIIFIGTGEHFDDLSPFDPNAFLSKLLGLGDVAGLVDKIKDAGIDSKSELYQRFSEGVFTFRDMYEHLQNMMKMGPMGKIMEMLPGMGQQMFNGEHSTKRLKVYMTIMDSMNDKELDSDNARKTMTFERCLRISKGSGRGLYEVKELLGAYAKFEDMVKKMGRLDLKKLENPSALQGKQGAQSISELAQALDPQVLRQLGGMGGLQHMMVQLAQSEQDEKNQKKDERQSGAAAASSSAKTNAKKKKKK
ncbi:Signal recognition particle 54 kDa protein 2 [Diplonema papillatum]|nr:Signal recognition particle 54 kDa protein 2 [Diplonema papillatum]